MNPLLTVLPPRRLVIGHRGNSRHAPENTMESFRQAVSLGIDALEFDVHLTRDGQAVVMHDPTLDRTTSGTGRVADLTLDAIRRVDAGARFSTDEGRTFPYAGQGIVAPTLEEVLTEFPSLPLIIEIKTPTVSSEVLRVIRAHGAESRCVPSSFVDHALDVFQGTGIPIGASPQHMRDLFWPGLLRRRVATVPFQLVSMPTVHKGLPLPVGGFAHILAPLGVPVHVWTIDDPQEAQRLWAKGVRGILTNDPGAMIRAAAQ
ncbi:MAG: glycerophosphodiester phosphodiesterase [Gemmatimonadaceae bacterium]